MILSRDNWQQLLQQGFELQSSATTGPARPIFQPPQKLAAANQDAIEAQGLTPASRVLTVCRMTHAGGVLAQTLPALSIGARVDIKPFSAFGFWQDIQGYTHTHLTPAHCQMLVNTRSFQQVNFDGLFITCGSDHVPFSIIEAFVRHQAVFMCNWGMTEIGPIVINTVFDSIDKVREYRHHAIDGGTLMGDRCYCDYKIVDDELWVQGASCVYDGWYNSKDRVAINSAGHLYHMGRNSLAINP